MFSSYLLLDLEWSKVLLPGGNIKMDVHTIRKPSLSSPSLAFLQGWKSSGLGNVSDRGSKSEFKSLLLILMRSSILGNLFLLPGPLLSFLRTKGL